MSDRHTLNDRELFQKAFLIVVIVFISALFFSMIRSFFISILLAGIFSGLMTPLYNRFERRFRGRKNAASACTMLIMVLVVIVPLVFLLSIVTEQAIRVGASAGPWIQSWVNRPDEIMTRLQGLPFYDQVAPYRVEILTKVGELAGGIGNFVVGSLSSITRGTIAILFQTFVMLYAMFFFLMDGKKLLDLMMHYSPLPRDVEVRMAGKFVSVSRATIKGTLVIGAIQGTGAALALSVAGIPSTIFWGAVMTVLSIIPGIGTAIVWVPAVIYLAATGHWTSAILVTIWCALIVGSVDNFLRPRLVGKDTQMHDLMVLFSSLGGILAFGLVGFIIGPIIAALFISAWDLYGVTFKGVLPEDGEATT